MPTIACKNKHLELYLDDVTDKQLELINRVHNSLSSDNHVVDYEGNKYLAASIIYKRY